MVLSIFDYSNKIRDSFIAHGIKCKSLDIMPGHKGNLVDICVDILDFNYKVYSPEHIKFLFIALPCQCYSIASAGKHFKNSKPLTPQAYNAINILIKIWQMIKYFDCPFVIENPSGGLCNNRFFNSFFNLNMTRLTLYNFGFPTQKKTDLFYNFDMLLLVPVTYRVNKRYQRVKLDNLGYRKRVTYPEHFVKWIVSNIIANVKLN